jgi:hypothetical protein
VRRFNNITGLFFLLFLAVFALLRANHHPGIGLAHNPQLLVDEGTLFLPLAIREPYTTPIPTQTPGPSATPSPTSTFEPPDGLIWVDSRSVALFDHIPEQYLTAASNTRMLFSDRSVGQNISEGLDCLTATSWSTTLASCRRDYTDTNWNWKTFTQTDLDQGLVPDEILFHTRPGTV